MRQFVKARFLAAPLLVAASFAASAETFDINIDTGSLSGQAGGIYFQFSPGLNADPASVAITDFALTPPGALNPASPLNFSDGGASGTLDANDLVINNNFALNDYGEALTFGSDISFAVTLNLPPVLTGQSGSELGIQVTGPDLLTPLLTSDPSGNVLDLSYDQTGSLNVLSTTSAAGLTEAPEPATAYVIFPCICLLIAWRLRRPQLG